MQKLSLKQKLTQRLTPQQIQLIKLLQIPSIDINARIEQELTENPVLESSADRELVSESEENYQPDTLPADYLEESFYKQPTYKDSQAEERWAKKEAAISNKYSLQESLLEQLKMIGLNEKQYKIGQYLIGNLEPDGYIRRSLTSLANDLLLNQYMQTDAQEIQVVLQAIHTLDPAGIGARDLQECLLIQLNRQGPRPVRDIAIQIISQAFEAFSKKHYLEIIKKLAVQDSSVFKESLELIAKLNPKPGSPLATDMQQIQVLYPDFVVNKQNDELIVLLNNYNTPELKISKSYLHILQEAPNAENSHQKNKNLQEATSFVKKKVEAAKWFMEALRQRQKTLLITMQAMVQLQYDFFMEGDEAKLKPMILKNVAQIINMDISTISRIVNNKSVQTQFGIFPLKFFFSEAIPTTLGKDVSNKAVKQDLLSFIEQEDKQHPYADEQLTAMLVEKGYAIARRTVAKYREQLHIPVARLRKEL